MCKLSEDEESIVRSELVQHIPSIALFCQSHPSGLKLVIQQQLVPYTVKLLNDPQIQVRKFAQSALLVLLENSLIGQLQLAEWICPLIAQLAMCDSNHEEQRIEDVTVMSMMIPLVDKDMTIKFFLEPYVSLCCDQSFGIRTVCAMRFGTLCKIVGTEITELSLLPSFLNLCCDTLWGVRKACADVFVDVASVVSLKTRKEVLPHIFINLLNDASRYVESAAYHSLGGVISTFADPLKTGCSFKDGKLHVDESFYKTSPKPAKKKKERSAKLPSTENIFTSNFRQKSKPQLIDFSNLMYTLNEGDPKMVSGPLSVSAMEGHTVLHVTNENTFNTFQYWRTPLPEVELDIDMDDGGKATAIHVRSTRPGEGTSEIMVRLEADAGKDEAEDKNSVGISQLQVHSACINTFPVDSGDTMDSKCLESINSSCQSKKLTFNNKKLVQVEETVSQTSILSDANSSTSEDESESMLSCDQDIVPSQLLFKYTSIVDHTIDNIVDKKVESCAFSFPAVAYTLGRKYWPCIRNTCKELASDVKWSVRCAIASSLHELATILGDDLTVRDLLPIFLEYLGDVDDVRVRLLTHLPQFLVQLDPSKRWFFLPSLAEFTHLYNDNNWRFRCTLSEKLQLASGLYSTSEVLEYFLPVAQSLLQDRVAAVRISAAGFMAHVMRRLYNEQTTRAHCMKLLSEFDAIYRKGKKWSQRQTFVALCDELAIKISIPVETYKEEVLSGLFLLASDRVPNVRLAAARCLAGTLSKLGYLDNLKETQHAQLIDAVNIFSNDKDVDVMRFARLFTRLYEKERMKVQNLIA